MVKLGFSSQLSFISPIIHFEVLTRVLCCYATEKLSKSEIFLVIINLSTSDTFVKTEEC